MINQPLNAIEKTKIILYFILLLATFVFAMVPVALISISMSRAKRYANFAPLDSARIMISIYFGIVTIGFAVAGVLNTLYVNGDEAMALFTLAGMGAMMLLLTNILFFNTLKAHQNWIIQYGIFVDALDVNPNESLPMDSEVVEK